MTVADDLRDVATVAGVEHQVGKILDLLITKPKRIDHRLAIGRAKPDVDVVTHVVLADEAFESGDLLGAEGNRCVGGDLLQTELLRLLEMRVVETEDLFHQRVEPWVRVLEAVGSAPLEG